MAAAALEARLLSRDRCLCTTFRPTLQALSLVCACKLRSAACHCAESQQKKHAAALRGAPPRWWCHGGLHGCCALAKRCNTAGNVAGRRLEGGICLKTRMAGKDTGRRVWTPSGTKFANLHAACFIRPVHPAAQSPAPRHHRLPGAPTFRLVLACQQWVGEGVPGT